VGRSFFEEMALRAGKSPGEVVMVICRPVHKLLVHSKSFYPPGVYRLLTGGIRPGETAEDALAREAWEETGFRVQAERSMGVIPCAFRCGGETVVYPSHVLLTSDATGVPTPVAPDEDITALREMDPAELPALAQRLRSLPAPWDDWGRWRAVAHEFVYQQLAEMCSLFGVRQGTAALRCARPRSRT
jgi:8-oxo-dGTP pyrophosphatase MutT (NUDIX family)